MLPPIVPKFQVIWCNLIKQTRLDQLAGSAFLKVNLGFIHQIRTSSLLSFVCSSSVWQAPAGTRHLPAVRAVSHVKILPVLRLQPHRDQRRHGLRLVTSSIAEKHRQ